MPCTTTPAELKPGEAPPLAVVSHAQAGDSEASGGAAGMNHSPLPWKVIGGTGEPDCVVDATGELVLEFEEPPNRRDFENAVLIVRSVNAFHLPAPGENSPSDSEAVEATFDGGGHS